MAYISVCSIQIPLASWMVWGCGGNSETIPGTIVPSDKQGLAFPSTLAL